jgi:hypothetical protein
MRETVSAPQSTAASAAGIQATFIFVVDSLDKHIQNEKELIRLRRFMPAARTTRARSAQFRLRRELPCTRVVSILPAAQTTRTRHQRGAVLYLYGE